ncbi:MAG: PQQ-dependent sugar dehydrogenase [Chloroflexi bacterium]|nr:PQQ-dependent sugar dehydrogenase [Chloroflexota bacterium]
MLSGILALVLGLVVVIPSIAQEPEGENYDLALVVDGLERPLFLIEPDDGTGRLFILEQPGRIRIVEDGELLDEPFLDLTESTGITANERGLLGLAFDPSFAENGYFYVDYTRLSDGHTVVSRFTVSEDDPNRADPDSETMILFVEQPFGNHNGGMVAFGPDGYLYVGLGDGGSGGDPRNNGQNPNTLLGTILRIDPVSTTPYAIPDDNPFVDSQEGAPEVWAYGLRNPWRFSFDIETGDLYIADVGQNAYEEINFQPADSSGGENYGWNVYEASLRYSGGMAEDAVFPVAEYGRSEGCSITGGYVYRGESLPDLEGVYFYADYCTGTIWWLNRSQEDEWDGGVLMETDLQITSFGQDLSGEIYVIDRGGGIYKLVAE